MWRGSGSKPFLEPSYVDNELSKLFLKLGLISNTFLGPTYIALSCFFETFSGWGGGLDIVILMKTESSSLTLTSTDDFGFVKSSN